jgi:hypothetical protein
MADRSDWSDTEKALVLYTQVELDQKVCDALKEAARLLGKLADEAIDDDKIDHAEGLLVGKLKLEARAKGE